jgi:hypothetical protein
MIKSAADTDANESKVRQIDNREDANIFALVTPDSEVTVDNCNHVRYTLKPAHAGDEKYNSLYARLVRVLTSSAM